MISTLRLLAVGTLLSIGFSTPLGNSSTAAQIQVQDRPQSSLVWYQQDEQKLAVTEIGWDDIGKILDSSSLAYDTILNSDLVNYELIKKYDVIFINCSEQAQTYAESAKASLEQYVREGGKLYASDYAFVYVAEAFPGNVNYYGYDEGVSDADPYIGHEQQTVTADIIDAGLQKELNSQTVDIYFDLTAWVPIDNVSDSVHIVLAGDIQTINGDTLTDKPLSVSFPYGEGYVLYTSYHNEVGDQPVTPEQQTLLQYLVRAAAEPEIIATPVPTATPVPDDSGTGKGVPVYIIVLACLCCLAFIFVVAAVAAFFIIRNRRKTPTV